MKIKLASINMSFVKLSEYMGTQNIIVDEVVMLMFARTNWFRLTVDLR